MIKNSAIRVICYLVLLQAGCWNNNPTLSLVDDVELKMDRNELSFPMTRSPEHDWAIRPLEAYQPTRAVPNLGMLPPNGVVLHFRGEQLLAVELEVYTRSDCQALEERLEEHLGKPGFHLLVPEWPGKHGSVSLFNNLDEGGPCTASLEAYEVQPTSSGCAYASY